jgi:hypothetical protein
MPKKAEVTTITTMLISQANPFVFQVNPTLAAADFSLSKDSGAFAALSMTPTVSPAGGAQVVIALSAAEMDCDFWQLYCHDVSGAEWQDQAINGANTTQDIDDVLAAIDYTAADNATIAANASAISALGSPMQSGAAVELIAAYDAAKTAATQDSVDDLTDDVYALTHNEGGDTVPRVIPPPDAANYCTVYEIVTSTTTRTAPANVTATAKLIALPYDYNGQLFTGEVIIGTYADGVVSWQLPYGARALVSMIESNVLGHITVPSMTEARVYTLLS